LITPLPEGIQIVLNIVRNFRKAVPTIAVEPLRRLAGADFTNYGGHKSIKLWV